MLETIRAIENKLLAIQALAAGDWTPARLEDGIFVAAVAKRAGEAYMLMNEGMCEELAACRHCSANRDTLRAFLDLVEDIEAGDAVTPEMGRQFEGFASELEQMMQRVAVIIAELQS